MLKSSGAISAAPWPLSSESTSAINCVPLPTMVLSFRTNSCLSFACVGNVLNAS